MSVVGLDQVGSRAAQASEQSKGSALGKNDFLNLLVTQLQNQDPLNPADSTEFTAQLATFSSLEELQNINTTLEAVEVSQAVLTNSQAVDYIGKQIQAVGNRIRKTDGETDAIEFNLSNEAAEVYIKIYNQHGDFVQDIDLGPLPAGQQSAAWDGLDSKGDPAPDGAYTYEVMAIDADGSSIGVTGFTTGRVTGVYYKYGGAYLMTADQEIPLGNVVQVYE